MKKTIDVSILGQKFKIRSEEDDEYIQSVAKFVDSKVKETTQGRAGASLQVVLLTAMNIADELFRTKRNLDKKVKLVEQKIGNVIELIEEEGGTEV